MRSTLASLPKSGNASRTTKPKLHACRSLTNPIEKYIRMAHLACVGSQKINGVAEIHTQLLKTELLRDFDELWPGKIINVTNGVTPRRWLQSATRNNRNS